MVAFRPQLADLDGKGQLSLLAGSNCCDVCGFFLFRRAADGSWEPRRKLTIAYPRDRKPFRGETLVSAADWDGDGVPDLLAVELNSKGLVAARGPLGGAELVRFDRPLALPRGADGPDTDWVAAFAVADWDRDGKPGLLVEHVRENRSRGLYWYKNLGGPGLTRLAAAKLVLDLPVGKDINGFCVADWNGDGWPDLVTTRREATGREPATHAGWQNSVWVHLRE